MSRYWGRYGLVLVTNLRNFVLVGVDPGGSPAKLETFTLAEDAEDFWRNVETPRAFAREVDLVSNWAYMVMAALAWNLKSWFALMMHFKADRKKYVAMEFRTFVREMILLPCQVIRRARQTTLRIIGGQPSADRLFSVWRTIERTAFQTGFG